MITKKTLLATAVCYWSEEDDSYVVETPLFPRAVGVGDTPREAREHFEEMLSEIYEDYATGNVLGYNKAGRPAKNGVNLHTSIRPNTKSEIDRLAKALDISQGEVIDFAIFAATHTAEKTEQLRNRLDNFKAYPKSGRAKIREVAGSKMENIVAESSELPHR